MKVLFIGGTGVISSACSHLAISKGFDLFLLNRGNQDSGRIVHGAKSINADFRSIDSTKEALKNHRFDVVVDWISYTKDQLENSIDLFSDKTGQFIFISSASAYQTPPKKLPITETTPLENPFWQYSRDKIACENVLKDAFKNRSFPYTIVRPSHTYDKTSVPLMGGYTALKRMQRGLPVVVQGDGTSIWTLTHHEDFAVGLVGLLGNKEAIGEDYHITSNELLTWNTIYELMAEASGVEAKLVHIPSHIIADYDKEIGAGLLGDKTHSMIFDNSKIKQLVPKFDPKIPFSVGAKLIVDWYANHNYPNTFDDRINTLMNQMIADHGS